MSSITAVCTRCPINTKLLDEIKLKLSNRLFVMPHKTCRSNESWLNFVFNVLKVRDTCRVNVAMIDYCVRTPNCCHIMSVSEGLKVSPPPDECTCYTLSRYAANLLRHFEWRLIPLLRLWHMGDMTRAI